ncbi:MAG: DUF1217 domain-containing protein [Hyphomicrobium sp.]|nr:DUF1217 domain-containing protein [Hyphomicrobium sp.]
MLTAALTYRNITRDLDRSLSTVATTPQVARETANYLEKIGKIKSVDDFMADKRVLRYAMTAFGLGDVAYATALVRRLLDGGVDSSDALANRFNDQRYRDFVSTFNFARYGTATTSFGRTQEGTVDRYQRQILEENVGESNPGARLALYFQRKAPNLTSSLGLLADAALLKVTQTALGLSPTTSNLSIDAQRALIDQKLSVADFKDPQKLGKFLNKFTALWDLNNPPEGTTRPLVTLLDNSNVAIGSDLLSAIQRLRSRG